MFKRKFLFIEVTLLNSLNHLLKIELDLSKIDDVRSSV